jgi:hypothetical protein
MIISIEKSTSRSRQLVSDLGDLSIEHPKKKKFDSVEMENPQLFPTVTAVHELFEERSRTHHREEGM